MNKQQIQNITFIATSLGIIALALWTLPQDFTWYAFFGHIAFEVIRASILIGNIQVTKQSSHWVKPSLVFLGSIALTILIGLQIASEFPVSSYMEYLAIPEFWGKQMGNIAVLLAEVTLMFQLGSDSDSYKIKSQKLLSLEGIFNALSMHYDIDHSNISEWEEVAKLVLDASQSERTELGNVKNELRIVKDELGTVKNELGIVKPSLEKVKTVLEMNRILLQDSEVSINKFAPIICDDCNTINPTNSNRQERIICSGCGKEATKPVKTKLRKLRNG